MKLFFLPIVVLYILTVCSNSFAQFDPPKFINVGEAPFRYEQYLDQMITGDFNNDGNQDVLISIFEDFAPTDEGYWDKIFLCTNDGYGNFTPGHYINFLPGDMITVNYNNDGYDDLLFIEKWFSGHSYLVLNKDNGRREPIKLYNSIEQFETETDEVDINEFYLLLGDTIKLIRNSNVGYILVRESILEYIGPHPTIADYDKDGDIDMLVGDERLGLGFIENLGFNDYAPIRYLNQPENNYLTSFLTNDFNNDGLMDVAILTRLTENEPPNDNGNGLCILLQSDVITVNKIANSNLNTKVYPNPSNGIFNIELPFGNPAALIEIYSKQGKKIKAFSLTAGRNKIDLSDYIESIFYFKITSLSESQVVKVFKL